MAKLIFKCSYIKGKRSRNFVRYIATREGVEKYISYVDGRPKSQGLFSDANEPPVLNRVMKELAAHNDVIFTPVISLRPEDAVRLGYDSPKAWQTLLRAHAQTFAQQMGVPLENLRWVAAFHNEPTHPHCHAVMYSTGRQPYLTRRGIDNIRSALARDIFKQDLMQVYEQQTTHRDDLRHAAKELVQQHGDPVVEDLLHQLAGQLRDHKGKKVYAYLSPAMKATVNRVVDELAKDPHVAQLYDLWYEQREAVLATYASTFPERIALSENEVFKSIKNAVVAEAAKLQFEQHKQAAQQNGADNLALGSLRLLGQLANIIESDIDNTPAQVQTDSKLRLEIAKKKQEQGLRI
ncbi:MAG: relaxase MobL [Oscillospiraceae bacterium]|nr:relaxase MobL [Oscillospiraceae bacterium]